ncbi:MAG: EFR1 family ferrodoxin [Candidatus Hermodarchaeota archaeon]
MNERKKDKIDVKSSLNGTISIYYFSGTGNSLYIAKKIAEKLNDCELIPISKIWQQDNPSSEAERIGFIFPLYYLGLPAIIYDFVSKFNVSSANYIFTLITSGGGGTGTALNQINKMLKKKSKLLNGSFCVRMPGNYIPMYNVPSKEEQKYYFKHADEALDKIVESIRKNETVKRKEHIQTIAKPVNKYFRNKVNNSDRKFYADENCNSCEICEKVCPVNNIKIIEGIPIWQHKCQQCLACIHFCPQNAIQYGKKTSKRSRYHHPEIKVNEIMSQK